MNADDGDTTAMAGATDIEARVRTVLDGLGVPYEILPIDPDFAERRWQQWLASR